MTVHLHATDEYDDYRPPFFGEPWDAPITDHGVQVPTPLGRLCLHCTTEIIEGDQGMFTFLVPDPDVDDGAGPAARLEPVHRECTVRAVLGPWSHAKGGTCRCATEPPAPCTAWREEGRNWLDWLAHHDFTFRGRHPRSRTPAS